MKRKRWVRVDAETSKVGDEDVEVPAHWTMGGPEGHEVYPPQNGRGPLISLMLFGRPWGDMIEVNATVAEAKRFLVTVDDALDAMLGLGREEGLGWGRALSLPRRRE
jgi:hypothetical protein